MNPQPMSPDIRRRNRWPILILLALLLVGAGIVWITILAPEPPEATGCNEPGEVATEDTDDAATQASGTPGSATDGTGGNETQITSVSTTLGTFTDPNMLAGTRPADPGRIPLQVYNASMVAGQAKTVTDELRSIGFTSIKTQADDPLYPAWDLRCYGEIRFGYGGLAEARTVLFVAPCAELVLDDRVDNSVDLSLGKLYQVEPIDDEVQTLLTQIADDAAPPPVIEGQTIQVRPASEIPPLPDRSHCPA